MSRAAVRPSQGGVGPWLLPVLLVTAAAMVSQGFVRFTFAFVIEPMRLELFGDYTTSGAFGAANLGAYVGGVLTVMLVGHRLTSATLVKLGLLGSTVGLFVVGLAPSVPVVFLGIVLAGFMSAAVWLPITSIIAAAAPPARRGLAFGLMTMGVGATITITGVLTGQVRNIVGPEAWREVWLIEACVAGVIFLAVLLRLHTPERTSPTTIRGLTPHGRRIAWKMSVVYGIYGLGFAIYIHYLIVCLVQVGGMSPDAATQAYSFLGIASIFGSVILARTSDFVPRARMLAVAMATTGLCALAAVTITNHVLLTVTVIVFGLVMTGIGSVLSAYLSDQVQPAEMAVVFGAATLTLGFAQVISPPAGGWLADVTGSFHLTYGVALVTGLVSGVLAWRLPRHAPDQP